MGKYEKIVVVIPAYNPDEKLLDLLKQLQIAGFLHMILVNDGSSEDTDTIFQKAKEERGVHLLKHSVNLGKGRAYKTAFNYYIGQFPTSTGVVACDADGQHHIDDIRKCADMLLRYPDGIALGVRSFDMAGISFRSWFGNKCTSVVFRLFCGMDITDTQTGLKGIPNELTKIIIETPGERYEYETSVLLELHKRGVPVYQFDIKTIYIDENQSSHFHPLWDSIKIYRVILKYICASLVGTAVDYVVFLALSGICKNIFILTYAGRVLSAVCNFTLNKKFVFQKKGNICGEVVKYMLLLFFSGTVSAVVVSWMHTSVHLQLLFAKMITETMLFFFNYYVQKKYIFKNKG